MITRRCESAERCRDRREGKRGNSNSAHRRQQNACGGRGAIKEGKHLNVCVRRPSYFQLYTGFVPDVPKPGVYPFPHLGCDQLRPQRSPGKCDRATLRSPGCHPGLPVPDSGYDPQLLAVQP